MALMQYQGQGVQYQYNGQYNVPGGHPAGGDDDDDDDENDVNDYDVYDKDDEVAEHIFFWLGQLLQLAP